jgi:hypothetical protein
LALLFPSFPGLFRRVSSCFVVNVPGLLAWRCSWQSNHEDWPGRKRGGYPKQFQLHDSMTVSKYMIVYKSSKDWITTAKTNEHRNAVCM